MELIKYSREEQVKIDQDRSRPHAVMCVLANLTDKETFQESCADAVEKGMRQLRNRADAAKMQILSTSISTNIMMVGEVPYAYVMVLCQWVEVEKLQEMQRRAALVGGSMPGRGI